MCAASLPVEYDVAKQDQGFANPIVDFSKQKRCEPGSIPGWRISNLVSLFSYYFWKDL